MPTTQKETNQSYKACRLQASSKNTSLVHINQVKVRSVWCSSWWVLHAEIYIKSSGEICMLRSIFKQIIRWAGWDVDLDYALRSAYWDVNLDHVVRSTVVLLYWDQVRSAWCWDSGEIWKIFKSNVEIWKLRHLFKSSGEIKDVCWDEVLRCIFRSGVEICMPRCIFKSCVEIIMLRHEMCPDLSPACEILEYLSVSFRTSYAALTPTRLLKRSDCIDVCEPRTNTALQ